MNLIPSTRAVINLPAFQHNLDVVRSYVGSEVMIMAVVKADAYGHGLKTITREALRCGVHYLGVARVDEGMELRKAGIAQSVLVFEVAPVSSFEMAVTHDLELTISTVEAAQRLVTIAERAGLRAKVHIKVDTGMGRLGFPYESAVDSIETICRYRQLDVVGLYSHFATSEESDQTFARLQLQRFQDVLQALARKKIEIPIKHMANSGAIINFPESHLQLVRPGIMLYGYTPSRTLQTTRPLKPVMSLLSKVALIKTVEPGTSISYGREYTTTKPAKIVTIPIGYADGYSRALTNGSEVIIRGRKYPVVGTICMDQIMVEMEPSDEVEVGDDVTLIGSDGTESISCWDIAERLGTIPYEITCLITPRVARVPAG